MRVVIGSAWRNSAGRVQNYMSAVRQLSNLMASEDVSLRVIAVEGDSKDRTRELLTKCAKSQGLELELVICEHGGPEFGSTEAPERMKALSKVGNAIFDSVKYNDDVLLYVESDLSWVADDLLSLARIACGRSNGWDVAAPMVMAGDCFYDVWAFRGLDGRRFSPFAPYYPGLEYGPLEIGSVGSCLAMRGEVARTCRIRDENCLVGWCADAREKGYKIGVYPEYTVRQA